MAEPYVPVYLDWIETTEALNDQEKGRLIDAIVLYARGEDWQDRIKGNERFVFPSFRRAVDRNAEISAKRSAAGSVGGQRTQANASKNKQTQANASYEDNNEDKDNNEEEIYIRASSKKLAEEFEELWQLYPKKQGKKRAYEAYCRDRKKGHTFEEIKKGVEAYAHYVSVEKTEEQYIKQGDTFFSQAAWDAGNQWIPRKKQTGSTGRELLPESERDTELPF